MGAWPWSGIKPQPPSKVVGHKGDATMKSIKGQKRDIRRVLINEHGYTWGQIKDLDLAQLRSLIGQ